MVKITSNLDSKVELTQTVFLCEKKKYLPLQKYYTLDCLPFYLSQTVDDDYVSKHVAFDNGKYYFYNALELC